MQGLGIARSHMKPLKLVKTLFKAGAFRVVGVSSHMLEKFCTFAKVHRLDLSKQVSEGFLSGATYACKLPLHCMRSGGACHGHLQFGAEATSNAD